MVDNDNDFENHDSNALTETTSTSFVIRVTNKGASPSSPAATIKVAFKYCDDIEVS